ncbi:MAG TPA: efflux transporter outer membrane subunit, partial [Alphaproteobacteria bacterium]|nr:efflux transporter outer membrane subunit [Alphaproteobacteria bacterium]
MKKLLWIIGLVMLAGCTSASHDASEVSVPSAWTNPSATVNDASVQIRWWEQFNDTTLNNLVQAAVAQNLDLKIAKTRIRAARAQLLATKASFLPDINGSASIGKTRGSTRTGAGALGGGERDLYDIGLDSTWEFNVFGISPAIEAADATLQSEKENEQGVLLSLLGEVAQNYIELRRLQNALAVTDQSIAAYKASLDITDARLNAGLVSALDSSRAETALQTQLAERPELVSQINAAIRRIEVLLGQNPGTLDATLATPAAIPFAGSPMLLATPAAVIANRPDVRAAEQDLIASNATKRVATAQYFPSLSLPAAFGWQADRGGDLFSSGAQAWSFAGMVKLPIFDFGRIRADVQLTDANAEAAFLQYQKSVQGALS